MKRKIFCSLDIGNSKLTAVLAKAEKQRINILATATSPVRGLSKGRVAELADLVDCIQQILDKLSSETGINIKSILISVNGDYIHARYSFAAVALSEIANRQISLADINYLRRQAKLLGVHMDETILHEFPQTYILDDDHSTFNPLGLLARKIKLNSYLLSASHTLLGNVKTAVQQAGYDIEDVLYSGVASGFSVLSAEEKEKGVLLIDLGACFTSLLFFKDKILRDFKIIPFGGNDITDDISKSLELPWELAEDLKKSSLVLSAQDPKASDKVVVRRFGSYKTLERSAIYEAAKIRLEEFLGKVRSAIHSSIWKDKMTSGIVGVGGAANLEGILEKIESSTGMPVRLGHIKDVSSGGGALGPQFAAAVGLIYYSDAKNLPSLKSYLMGKTPLERATNFIRNLYQDYF
ncbi:MAG: cell division protein FtsA [Candidatus Omnitrophica bacterium]|nr:cell division protein FtsA [Candidatus Omnitrophota bacterium]MDD5352786.1 cell division protein FtsA [Candidatus Omnitrophota bacterium]MDD5550385.1 cell division protein FtsA [Candidatus Omnitrophota bacterium]